LRHYNENLAFIKVSLTINLLSVIFRSVAKFYWGGLIWDANFCAKKSPVDNRAFTRQMMVNRY